MDSGLFTEKDCLDLLGLLYHLFKRLDESEKKENEAEQNTRKDNQGKSDDFFRK